MQDKIQKLYELANIEKYYLYTVKHLGKIHIAPLEGILENKHLFERNKKSKVKNTYINRVKKVYPSFTPEKQLELIKWISNKINSHNILYIDKHNNQSRFSVDKCKYDIDEDDYDYSFVHTDFSQALAGLVCELWEDLTPEQQAEIKRILE